MVKGYAGGTPLHHACVYGFLDVVQWLIEDKKVDPSCLDHNNATPLHIAAQFETLQVVRYLVEEGACEVMSRNEINDSPLHVAALCGRLDTVSYLINEKSCDKMARGQYDRTPLHYACIYGHEDVVRYLIMDQKVDPSRQDENNNTPLHIACWCGQLSVVKLLVEECVCDTDITDKWGKTPSDYASEFREINSYLHSRMILNLLSACRIGDFAEVKHLIEKKCINPCLPDCHHNNTNPLHEAVCNGHLKIVEYLIEKGCDLSECCDTTDTVHTVVLNGKLGTLRYLLSKGFNPMCKDGNGRTLLHHACQKGYLDIVQYLIEDKRVDPTCQDNKNDMSLHIAVEMGKLKVVKYLINSPNRKQYGDISNECRGEYGRTLLHKACLYTSLALVRYLIEGQGVNASCRDEEGATPLHIAAESGKLDIVRYLIDKSVCNVKHRYRGEHASIASDTLGSKSDTLRINNLMCKGQCGKTPLHYACQNDKLDIVEYFIGDQEMDLSCRDDNDATPLHIACMTGQLSIVQLLVEKYRCDVGATDKLGRTALDCAHQLDKQGVVKYLSPIHPIVSTNFRRALVARLKSRTRTARPTGHTIGNGAYGSVIEVISAGETLAGKVFKAVSGLHVHVYIQDKVNKIEVEIDLMLNLQHPNIVESKGVCFLMDHLLPVLLMEKLSCSLHAYILKDDNSNMLLTLKVSILFDIVKGLAYLHSHTPAIIHRDMTAKNILLDSTLHAKIGDFGNARIMDLDPETSPETFTSMPGTLEYMPPEALGRHTKYDPSLDVFSFGHLALFTITQSHVALLPPSYTETEFGETKIYTHPEVKRRVNSIDALVRVLSTEHKLVAVIKQCLHNSPALRPHTKDLLEIVKSVVSSTESLSTSDHHKEKTSVREEKRECEKDETSHTENPLSALISMSQLIVMRTPKGQKVEIIMSVASKWSKMGDLLNFDRTGRYVRVVAGKGRDDPEICCAIMFRHWLEGNGEQPATWSVLIQKLEDCQLKVFAEEVKNVRLSSTDAAASDKQ